VIDVRRAVASLALALAACSGGGDDAGTSQPTPADVMAAATTRVVVEIAYVDGAEPYTGVASATFPDVWAFSRANLERLLRGKTLELPSTLSEMHRIPDPGKTEYTADDILAIAKAQRTRGSGGGTAAFFAVWLKGKYKDKDTGKVLDDVLGVSIGDTGVLALFKPVIQSTSVPGRQGVVRFVEQSTFTHEMGHALGLVNNGVGLASAHQDAAHGSHCTNEKCVMFWQNEGAAAAAQLALRLAVTGDEIVFGPECLADADKAAGR